MRGARARSIISVTAVVRPTTLGGAMAIIEFHPSRLSIATNTGDVYLRKLKAAGGASI